MRLLLPPSEAKRDGSSRTPLALDRLIAAPLAVPRKAVIADLSRLCSKPTPRVRAAIGTTIHQDAELARNVVVLSAPTAPAHAIYDGVLFDAIGLGSCTSAVLKRLEASVLVQSALFGVVSFGDCIPAYRCSANSVLPRLGRLSTYWRPRLRTALNELVGDQIVVDLRSGSYSAMWAPSTEQRPQTITVKVMQERGGRRIAVSHFNKATKGRIVRILGEQRRTPKTFDDVAQAIAAAGYEVELLASGNGAVLEVLIH